jgi:O-antigen/teichoic acid export membrane protein
VASEVRSSGRRKDATDLAKSGAISFAGSVFSSVLGFVLTFVLTRGLGETGTGIVLQATAVFAIVASVAKLGMDSAAVWLEARHVYDGVEQIRSSVTYLVVTSAAAGAVGGIGITVAGVVLARGGGDSEVLGRALVAIGWALPVFVVLLVVLSATRGLGGVLPYVLVDNVFQPAARPLLVVAALGLGGGAVAATVAWALPLPIALAVAAVVLVRLIRRHEGPTRRGHRWPTRDERRRIDRFALPRTLSAGLEQGLLYLDVVLVGGLVGSADAGVYGGASRFVAAGLIIDQALRVVVSPRFSQLIHAGALDDLQALYGLASRWLVLFSTPIYVLLAVFAPAILQLLGPGFDRGATSLVILSIGATLTLAAGNVHSVLLMSGHSGWAAFNKAAVLVANVVGNLLLVPRLGIEGAAIAWAAAMFVDAAMAAVEVRTLIGIRIDLRKVGYGLLVPTIAVGVPAAAARALFGPTIPALLVAAAVGGVALVTWCFLDRRRLEFDAFERVRGG